MTPEERQLLTGLFERIGTSAEAPRDKDAEALIADQVRQRPYAPYLLAQAVIIQEEALKAASGRIQELEGQLKAAQEQASGAGAGAGGFLGGLGKSIFGGSQEPPRPTSVPRTGSAWGAPPAQAPQPQQGFGQPQPAPGPWGQGAQPGPWGGGQPSRFGGMGGGGGFLQGAMATAAGVAGGALLYQGISSLFSGQHATGLMGEASGLADAKGLASPDAGSLGNDLFGGNSVLGGAQPASFETGAADPGAADEDPGYDDTADYGDDSGDSGDWA